MADPMVQNGDSALGRQRTAFFYGTLMAPQVLHRVVHSTSNPSASQVSALDIKPAILHGFSRHRVRDCDYPAITRPSGQSIEAPCVRGTLVKGITSQMIWRLDIFEGDQYERQLVKCRTLQRAEDTPGARRESKNSTADILESYGHETEGPEVEAETYVWIEDKSMLEEGEWDFDEFKREKIQRWVGMEQFEEVDEAVEKATPNDPTQGRGFGGEITKKLDKDPDADTDIFRAAV